MGAINRGFTRQGPQGLERLAHLLRRTLEQATATTDKQGIAAEENRPALNLYIREIGYVVQGMTGYAQHLESDVSPDHLVARVNQVGTTLIRGIRGAGDTAIRKAGNQLFDAANVVRVVMGHKDGVQCQVVRGQVVQNRLSLPGSTINALSLLVSERHQI